RQGAPNCYPRPKRGSKAPQANGGCLLLRAAEKSRAKHQPTTGETSQQAPTVNSQMCGGPKRVAPDGSMPGNIPKDADGDSSSSDEYGPGVNGNGRCAGFSGFARRHGDEFFLNSRCGVGHAELYRTGTNRQTL